jgi:hypothetical protein
MISHILAKCNGHMGTSPNLYPKIDTLLKYNIAYIERERRERELYYTGI